MPALVRQTWRRPMQTGCGGAVQGPPGTGKTKTLLGLLSVILYALPEGSMGLRKNRATMTQNLTTEEKACIWLSGLLRPNPRCGVCACTLSGMACPLADLRIVLGTL